MKTVTVDGFLRELEQAIEGLEPGQLQAATRFHELPQWDSLAVLATLTVVDGQLGVQMSADELRQCETLGDLFALASRKAS
jgi:acyl carrier protein